MSKHILIADTLQASYAIKLILTREGFQVTLASSSEEALAIVQRGDVDLALVAFDLDSDDETRGLALINRFIALQSCPIIATVEEHQAEVTRELIRNGAMECLLKPVTRELLLPILHTALERSQVIRRLAAARHRQGEKYGIEQLAPSSSPFMQQIRLRIRQVAPSDVSVMILGESGTGKEMVARAIHMESPRKDGPFVALNCGALPADLVEAELFGHERGAFTGAVQTRLGLFEQAQGGTLFLDEIGDMPLPMQVKLLRVLEERKVTRVGARGEIDIDCRVLCATHAHLADQAADGRFRKDLYYRLQVMQIDLPPLRERGDDVVHLAESFIEDFMGHPVRLQESTRDALRRHPWPGNVRELRNAVERAIVLAGSRLTELDRHLVEQCRPTSSSSSALRATPTQAPTRPDAVALPSAAPRSADDQLAQLLDALLDARARDDSSQESVLDFLERHAILAAYARCSQNKARAARLLGIERKAFERRLARYLPE